MKKVVSSALLLVASAFSFGAPTYFVDGQFVPPPDCAACGKAFTVTVAVVNERDGSSIGSPLFRTVDGQTPFKLPFSPPPGATRIKVTFTPGLQGFAPSEYKFELEQKTDTLNAFYVSWRQTGKEPNTVLVKNETKIKELISSPTS